MNLEIHNFTQNEIPTKLFHKILKKTLSEMQVSGATEVSLAIVGNGRMRRLNKMYRGKNRVTDVLSFDNRSVLEYLHRTFPRMSKDDKIFVDTPDNVKRLGEIVICYPQAKKQAKTLQQALQTELTLLFIHGLLHLLGFDHEKSSAAEAQMKEMEIKIFKSLK